MNQNRIENKTHLLQYAMHAGIFLGAFWAFNYLLFIFGQENVLLIYLHSMLRIGTPVLLFYFLKTYNERFVNSDIRFWHGVQFSILLFFFGSILESLMVLTHVKWIDPLFIATMSERAITFFQTHNLDSQAFTEAAQTLSNVSPFTYVFHNVFMLNFFLGLILSLPIVPLVQRFKIVRRD